MAPFSEAVGRVGRLAVLAAIALAAACSEPDPASPYLEFAGGGFVFNYRLATADYGFVARPRRRLPAEGQLEAVFENPAGGAPLVVREPVRAGRTQYVFRTPPLEGVRAGRDYRVELRVRDAGGRVLASYARTFRSDADQGVLPARPPVVGPGYQPG